VDENTPRSNDTSSTLEAMPHLSLNVFKLSLAVAID